MRKSKMKIYISDMEWYTPEGDDVVLGVKHLHCALFKEFLKDNWFEFRGCDIIKWLKSTSKEGMTIIGHNWINADMEVLRRLYGVDFTIMPDTLLGNRCRFIDTLTLSRRLNPDRQLPKGCPKRVYNPVTCKSQSVGPHSLMAWSYKLTGEKPQVYDWRDQPIEVYVKRCKADVKLTEELYNHLLENEMR